MRVINPVLLFGLKYALMIMKSKLRPSDAGDFQDDDHLSLSLFPDLIVGRINLADKHSSTLTQIRRSSQK